MIELQADMNITEGLSAELGDNLQLNAQLNDVFVAGVTSWNGQTGDVTYTPPTVPTKTSQLQNDSGFITSADVPSKTSDLVNDSGFLTSAVTSFNGQTGAVTYTAPVTSVNGQTGSVTVTVPTQTSQLQNDSGYITSAGAPVQSVNGQTGAVVLNIPTVPTNVSAFNNDAGYLTQHQSLAGYATQTWVQQQGYATETYVDNIVGDIESILAAI